MVKARSTCQQTNVGTGYGLEQVNGLNGPVEARWRNIHLNDQTRELTIRNIRNDQLGDYDVEIITSSMILHKILRITFSGVFSDEKDGVKTVSVKEGDPIHLHTHVTEIERDDPIEWTFGPQNIFIAKTDGKNKFISYNYIDARFKNKLHLNTDTADLTIKNSNSEHSGLYQLKIGNTTYTIQKRFSVNVSAHVLSILEIVLISVVALLLATAACFIIYKCRHRICKNSQEQRELNSHTAHSDVSADKDNEIRIPLQST
ncbi:hypothetical protein Q8A67_005700 [Cirrhinus molitorella]|uniref:Immunoglobulin V-set domain-containing protein n=1 Tax=Cirrhinus molitorella TaxID=172907 RepID=A0AA88TVM0_9TELE|nr:hypothetical protein Q8A67_005700 [Cirrhinus molitorella]